MRNQFMIWMFIGFALSFFKGNAKDTLDFTGQLSAYTHFNSNNTLPWWNGGRYIPEFTYGLMFPNGKLIDFDASVNLYGNAGLHPFDTGSTNGDIKPYRLWLRYSTHQFEFRVGLQKINFGSATILRPLMWFDRIDPRDPLKLTDGVWGVLARYYFLNNANIWLWGLYGNENLKGWETFETVKNTPEFGGRFQTPVPKGEAGFTYHHRTADCSSLTSSAGTVGNISENRFGFDAKFDMVVGWWIEASWSDFVENIGRYSSQEIMNLGVDYTFGLGNGLAVTFEQLLASYDRKPFELDNVITFSLLNLSYPVGIFDNISAIVYFDWENLRAYNFLNWQKQFNNITLYVMGYMNPKEYAIPTQGTDEILYAGNGVQVMVVFNY
jgi:hypothetical protein